MEKMAGKWLRQDETGLGRKKKAFNQSVYENQEASWMEN